MTNVYIVIHYLMDDQINEAVFSSYKKAEDFCNLNYKSTNDGYWRTSLGYIVDIEKHTIDDC